jgi:hypothetical protein
MPETSKMYPVGTLFSSSWQKYKEQFGVLVKIALIPALFIALGSIIAQAGFPAAIFGGLFSITGWILTIFASIAVVITLEHKTDFDESYRRSKALFWPYLWVSILGGLATIGGFVMLIVPGIILSIALGFSKFIIVLENRRGLDALTQSRAYVKGYWWATLGRYILLGLVFAAAMLVIYLPAALIFGKIFGALIYAVLLLLLTPFSFAYLYQIYKNLTALKPEVHASQAAAGKTFLTVSAVVGVIAPIVFTILLIVLAVLFAKPYLENNPAMLQQLQYQYQYGMMPTSSAADGRIGGSAAATSTGSPAGMHCGGFIRNAPTCPSGYHCQLNLRYPDTGGVCVAN